MQARSLRICEAANRGIQVFSAQIKLTPAQTIFVLVCWYSLFAAFRPLANPDEGRYTDIARWMVDSGDWLVPRLNGLPFLHKPPLYYWLEGSIISVLGTSLWAARLTSLGAALLTTASIFFLVRRFEGRRVAEWSILILATIPIFFGAAQYASLDGLVSAMIALTIASGALAITGDDKERRWLLPAAYLFGALGLLAKGLIGVVFPGSILVIWMLMTGRATQILKQVSFPGIVLFAIVAAPWFYLMELKFPGFNEYVFGYQQLTRFTGSEFSDQYGIYYYPAVLGVLTFPWSAIAIANARRIRIHSQGRDLQILGVIWLVFVLVFFSIPKSKLVGYTFPMLPPVALILAPWVASWRWRWCAVAASTVCCIAFGFGAAAYLKHGPAKFARQLSGLIQPSDEVVFTGTYYFDVAVLLDRQKPSLLVGRWNIPAEKLPDSLERQLMEGKAFDPASADRVLITPSEFEKLAMSGRRLFVVADAKTVGEAPLAGWPIVASYHRLRVVQVGK